MAKDISLVIVHYQNEALLFDQLDGLDSGRFEIIVVDNSHLLSQSDLPKGVKLISNPYNRGFSAGCNQGLSEASGEWVMFLNPDVLLSEQDLHDLVEYAKLYKLDALSPQPASLDYRKPLPSFTSLMMEFSPLGRLIPKSLHSPLLSLLHPFTNKTLTGGALLIKRSVIESLGSWDERFFLWFEDSDLSKRLIENGYKLGFAPVSINHLGGQSFSSLSSHTKRAIFFNGLDIYLRKHQLLFSCALRKLIINRFTQKKVIPEINSGLVSIVVPNLRKKLLDTFIKNNLKFINLQKTELIIVTSALDNATVWSYRTKYPLVRFIVVTQNQGFAHTVNIGLRAASGKYLGTINDDVILSKNFVEKLIKELPENMGSVNPVILDKKGKIESVGIAILDKGKALPVTIRDDSKQIIETDATNGAGVIYSKKALSSVGLFDEKFGSYLEDIDLSLRLQRNGFLNLVKTDSEMTHLQHQTSSQISFNKAWHDLKNWWLILLKNWSFKQWLGNLPSILIERLRNFSGLLKADKWGGLKGLGVIGLIFFFVFLRLYKIETSLLFFNDIGRDFLVMINWQETGKPPLLGPQTSALPYNQSAVYFYLLYPLFLLTDHSPFATIYTVVIFYLVLFLFGLYYLRKDSLLKNSFILSFLLITIHPQFIIQNRFVWNPSFIGPLILLAFAGFSKLKKKFSYNSLIVFALSISLAVSLNYSIAPLFIAFMLLTFPYFYKKSKFILIWPVSGLSILFWNLPTLFFEIRHNFILTSLLFNGEKLEQKAITLTSKINDTLIFALPGLNNSQSRIFVGLILFLSLISLFFKLKEKKHHNLLLALLLLVITVLITFIVPISMQAHYIFAILTMSIILISLVNLPFYLLLLIILGAVYLRPAQLNRYFSPAYRSVAETISCAELICDKETEPIFISVQSDIHPYHNGMEFKYSFKDAGCKVKELDTQINEATQMAVVVDHSEYTHGSTDYNELTQFGVSNEVKRYQCSSNLEVIMLDKN